MEKMLEDRETPFTDFRVYDFNGVPRAVFDRLTPEQNSLLSHFLYPSRAYIDSLYKDTLKVKSGELKQVVFEDDLVKANFGPRDLVIEMKRVEGVTNKHFMMKLPAIDARYLLLKWKFECIRWGTP